jgi:hypothetical protein
VSPPARWLKARAHMAVTGTEYVRAECTRDWLVGPTVGVVRRDEVGRARLNFLVG